mmetsp:Transcript_55094/g.131290  ORF Transcript_55094/g.131290 Transcript_55094/m.131290 type:complete len:112 (-) Transcript_55094:42-377(-)
MLAARQAVKHCQLQATMMLTLTGIQSMQTRCMGAKYRPRRRHFKNRLPPFKGFPGVTTPPVAQVMPEEIPAWKHSELHEEHIRAMLPPPPPLRGEQEPRRKRYTWVLPRKR